jgi:tRNA U38,U39,U40 pseudouridine synthase TruA
VFFGIEYKPSTETHEFYKEIKKLVRLFQGEHRFHNYTDNLSATMDQAKMKLMKIRAKKVILCGTEYVEFSKFFFFSILA